MSAERYLRAKSAFLAVCDSGDPEGELAAACGGDAELMGVVREMLREDAAGPSTLDGAAGGGPAARMVGRRVGRYWIRGVIGEGGMGVVYEAEQESPRRSVALKVIGSRFATEAALRRFRHEAEALGRLQHPGIAQILEAGEDRDTPFVAMELIRGEPVLAHAAAGRLDTRARLELGAAIADAVHHAHQKGVVHRDLKPAHILVDTSGQPKILDFGIARFLDGPGPGVTRQTSAGQLVGTLEYMSPEQAAGDPDAVDTRTDIYALGLILYELLGGRRAQDLTGRTLQDALRAIREAEPARLGAVDRGLRGDIETVVAHALEKDRERRYASAAELAADLRRVLRREPIHARPATAMYQVRKFAARNRGLVGAAGAVSLALLAGLVGVTAALQREIAARDAEARHRRVAEGVNRFLNEDLLAAVSPFEMGKDVSMRAVLDRAAAGIAGRFDQDPLVEAAIRSTLGHTYWQLGESELAEPHLVRALELQGGHGEEGDGLARAMTELGHLYRERGDFARAEPLYREAARIRKAVLGPTAADTINSVTNLAAMHRERGEWARALLLCQEAVELTRGLPESAEPRISAQENLAGALKDLGRAKEAVPLLEEVLRLRRAAVPADHPDVLRTMNSLAVSCRAAGDTARAIELFEEALETRRRVLGERHPQVLPSITNLASAYVVVGRTVEAERLYREAIGISREVHGGDHRATLIPMVGLGRLLRLDGRLTEAGPVLEEAVEGFKRTQGPGTPRTLDALNELAALYVAMERYGEAELVSAAALEGVRKALPPEHPNVLGAMRTRVECLRGLGRATEAEELQGELDRVAAAKAEEGGRGEAVSGGGSN